MRQNNLPGAPADLPLEVQRAIVATLMQQGIISLGEAPQPEPSPQPAKKKRRGGFSDAAVFVIPDGPQVRSGIVAGRSIFYDPGSRFAWPG
jgi:hypothetical protein